MKEESRCDEPPCGTRWLPERQRGEAAHKRWFWSERLTLQWTDTTKSPSKPNFTPMFSSCQHWNGQMSETLHHFSFFNSKISALTVTTLEFCNSYALFFNFLIIHKDFTRVGLKDLFTTMLHHLKKSKDLAAEMLILYTFCCLHVSSFYFCCFLGDWQVWNANYN